MWSGALTRYQQTDAGPVSKGGGVANGAFVPFRARQCLETLVHLCKSSTYRVSGRNWNPGFAGMDT